MSRIRISLGIVLIVFSFSLLFAQDKSNLSVEKMEVCTAVEERKPVGIDTTFNNTVEQLFCFTAISGAEDTTTISHAWYYQGEEKARVELKVKAKRWRTWTSKRIMEKWTGKWRVDVINADGKVLKRKDFKVKASE